MTWQGYANTGPFTNNTTPPGINATFLNNIESFLDQFAGSVVTDSSISTNGSGTLTIKTVQLTTGTITRIAKFSGTGTGSGQTVSHGLGANPDMVWLSYAGNFGSPPSHPTYWYNSTSSQVTIVADSGYAWVAIALKF